mmetsp:Transcript_32993/g.50516  ORF Transcript_32993/g.50516 Transcript_32993/m.50516 type:complete len:80 (-) Transcript_32993:999-1238(-)
MTEKGGGSDVRGGTSTNAYHTNPDVRGRQRWQCKVYGYKWFSSATDSDMTLSLARFPETKEELQANTGKIAMVFMRVRE